MKVAHIFIANFGDDRQKASLRDAIYDTTGYEAWINENGNVTFSCIVANLGGVLSALASSTSTDWIEYTIQFDIS
jgi:hypothetical protein